MTCVACGNMYPGKMIPVTDNGHCLECGRLIMPPYDNTEWDKYFHSICVSVASKSHCLSRQIGATLVRDHSIISTGYNGPARGIPHCGQGRFQSDETLRHLPTMKETNEMYSPAEINNTCPRQLLGYMSGTGMEYCTAQHAEENCISNAARVGTSTLGSTLYMNSVICCKNCFSTLINAGIKEIVVEDMTFYDRHTPFISNNSTIKIREFQL